MNYLRLLKHERGLIVSALVAGGAAAGLGVPIDFVLFGLTLAGIALFHHHTLPFGDYRRAPSIEPLLEALPLAARPAQTR